MSNKIYEYLSKEELTESEDTALFQELSAAYHRDEAAISSLEVRQLIERVQVRIKSGEPAGPGSLNTGE